MILSKFTKSLMAAVIAAGFTTALVGEASALNGRCDRYAKRYANREANPGGDMVGSGIAGALGGAALGGIFGGRRGVARGAIIGGGLGIFGGAVRGSYDWNDAYEWAYERCMNRGRRPRDRYDD